ncbi:hypothetical protein B0T24DRAFT_643045 [Lasiosphaeria ovina]|uniref:Uncharacterized protein n=1 Tax=Lasiosphaeria ovina TaxID=92902 RepID=A0AAE0JSX8_9PEZI|nr:hypothetical protein B0T24DRAFT_643045 [Lasiosphaeria ovina]
MAPSSSTRGVKRRRPNIDSDTRDDDTPIKSDPRVMAEPGSEGEGIPQDVNPARGQLALRVANGSDIAGRPDGAASQGPGPAGNGNLYTIIVGDEERTFPQSKFFESVWGDALDSPCFCCGLEFTLRPGDIPDHESPPGGRRILRSISLATSMTRVIQQDDDIRHPRHPVSTFRVVNRHFDCAGEADVVYLHISLNWHDSVASAKDLGSGEPVDSEPARLLHQTVADTLNALQAYDPGTRKVEIMHDYLSTPFWHPHLNRFCDKWFQSMKAPASTIPVWLAFHWHDVSSASLVGLYEDTSPQRFIKHLSKILESSWFRSLPARFDYCQTSRVLVISKDPVVFHASSLFKGLHDKTRSYLYGPPTSSPSSMPGKSKYTSIYQLSNRLIFNLQSWGTLPSHCLSIHAALHLIGYESGWERAEHIRALYDLMGLGAKLPNDRFLQVYRLAIWALEMGDPSPLLMIPMGATEPDPRAPWLRAYSELTWDLGLCQSLSRAPSIIRDGNLKARVEFVGTIMDWELFDVSENTTSDEIFCQAVSNILLLSSNLTAFFGAIDRIFPGYGNINPFNLDVDEWQKRRERAVSVLLKAWSDSGTQFSFNDPAQPYNDKQLDIAKSLVRAMELHQHGMMKYARLLYSFDEIRTRFKTYGRAMDGLAQIRCLQGHRDVFRLTCWETPKTKVAKVYRLPGRVYAHTVQAGLGIVVCEGRIIGRMTSGTFPPTCMGSCKTTTVLDLGSVILDEQV